MELKKFMSIIKKDMKDIMRDMDLRITNGLNY